MGYVFYVSTNPEIADLMFRPRLPRDENCAELQQAAEAAISGLATIIESGKRAGGFMQRDTDDLVLTSLSAVHGTSAFIASGLFVDADAPEVLVTALGERVYSTLVQGL